MELITTTFYNLKIHVLQSSGKWCYILKNTHLTSELYLDKISKFYWDMEVVNRLLCSYLVNTCSHADTQELIQSIYLTILQGVGK